MTKYDLTLIPISFIHIGNGEQLDPTEYIVKNGKVYYLNQTQMISYLMKTREKEFSKVLDTADMIKITDFFIENFNEKNTELWSASYKVDSSFETEYKRTLHDPRNQNLLYQFIRNKWQSVPFIPGSSLKGSLRTAFLSFLLNRYIDNGGDKDRILQNRNIEMELLNAKNRKGNYDMSEDPFKYVKVPDISFPNEFLNVKKVLSTALPDDRGTRRPASQIPAYHEVLDYFRAHSLQADMSIDERFWERTNTDFETFKKSINEFYLDAFEKDKSYYERMYFQKEYQAIKEAIEERDEDSIVLKVGKGSGKNYMTYEQLQFSPQSRNLIENEPMGWMMIQFKIQNSKLKI